MPGITITASREVSADCGSQTTWAAARDATTAASFTEYSTATTDTSAIQEVYDGVRYRIKRTFLRFDTSTVPGTISAMDLYVFGKTNNSCDVRPVKSTAFGGNKNLPFASTDFNDISDTVYSLEKLWSAGSYNVMALNGTAISDANSNNYLTLALIGNDYDYSDTEPLTTISRNSGVAFKSTTGEEIYLDIAYTPTGYGNDIIDIPNSSIAKVGRISKANIAEVGGIS